MRMFLPDDFKNKANDAARKILELHKQMIGKTELDAKFDYVKLARSLPTFGTHFFLVRVSDGFGNSCVKSLNLFYSGTQKQKIGPFTSRSDT